jgi:hypothetical protein
VLCAACCVRASEAADATLRGLSQCLGSRAYLLCEISMPHTQHKRYGNGYKRGCRGEVKVVF